MAVYSSAQLRTLMTTVGDFGASAVTVSGAASRGVAGYASEDAHAANAAALVAVGQYVNGLVGTDREVFLSKLYQALTAGNRGA